MPTYLSFERAAEYSRCAGVVGRDPGQCAYIVPPRSEPRSPTNHSWWIIQALVSFSVKMCVFSTTEPRLRVQPSSCFQVLPSEDLETYVLSIVTPYFETSAYVVGDQ